MSLRELLGLTFRYGAFSGMDAAVLNEFAGLYYAMNGQRINSHLCFERDAYVFLGAIAFYFAGDIVLCGTKKRERLEGTTYTCAVQDLEEERN